eukprot:2928762-Pleurochrysis_carterae.AAC.1
MAQPAGRLIHKAAAQRSCAVRVGRGDRLFRTTHARARRALTSTKKYGAGSRRNAGAGHACGRSPVRGAGDRDAGHALGDWKLRAQTASARQVHMRCGHKNGKCACEMERRGARRHLPK